MNEPRCRLFLVSPLDADLETFPACFAQAANAGDVASLLIRPLHSADDTVELISSVLATGYDQNVAILVDGDAEIAAQAGADGVQISGGIENFKTARSLLGSDRIVGVMSNGSRHTAMEIGEAGADYFAFDQSQPITVGSGETCEEIDAISWWSALFEIPSVAYSPTAFDDVEALVKAGSNFIRPEDAMWSSGDRAADTVKRYNARIEELV